MKMKDPDSPTTLPIAISSQQQITASTVKKDSSVVGFFGKSGYNSGSWLQFSYLLSGPCLRALFLSNSLREILVDYLMTLTSLSITISTSWNWRKERRWRGRCDIFIRIALAFVCQGFGLKLLRLLMNIYQVMFLAFEILLCLRLLNYL
ncbi:uncharacterized protein LOC111312359 [Durio zibethinus]|uniref:Uncharacterized protein LOC111312359 n=1 Tax=Durio zibethinus TaxID=66656 RepID=A0A6P6ATW0_DURZI|nr:uncharacterized protein LOC111312359 [Durio zibethinus]